MKINTTPLPPHLLDIEFYDLPLKEAVRNVYTVAFPARDGLASHMETFDNSETANKAVADGGELVEKVATVTPKRAFWDMYKANKAGMKRALKSIGVWLDKDSDGNFIFSTVKPANPFRRSRGYEREPQYSTFAGNVKFEY